MCVTVNTSGHIYDDLIFIDDHLPETSTLTGEFPEKSVKSRCLKCVGKLFGVVCR